MFYFKKILSLRRNCVWTLDWRVQFYPSMSYLHWSLRLSLTITDPYIRENCLSNSNKKNKRDFDSDHRLNRPGQWGKSFVRQMTQLVTFLANNSQLRQLREKFQQNYSLQSQLSNSQFRYESFVVISLSFTTISVVSSLSSCCWYCFNGWNYRQMFRELTEKVSATTVSYLLIEC